ncbi:MAG: multicopper oxidase domain-containing protein [Burkholderiales bacterium]
MHEMYVEDPQRRELLKLGIGITAGAIVPPLVAGCGGGGGSDEPVGPKETFVQPLDIQSKNGVLDVTIIVSYVTMPFQGTIVTLRNMFGTIPAPTLRVNVGDTLRIKIVNKLPPNVPPVPEAPMHFRYRNSTNLHVHGLHVYPDIYPQPAVPPYQDPNTSNPPKLYGDFVVDDPEQGIKPGEERQYEYKIRDDHPPGTYWYHPHLHGSSAIQVGSGMAGALIIEGAIDEVPEIAAAAEKVFVFQAPIYDTTTGKLEEFWQVGGVTVNEPNFVVNGVRRPRILMRAGEVQNWRFINAGTFKMLNLSLDEHTLYQYSHDGNPRRFIKQVPPLPQSAYNPTLPQPSYPEGVALAVGNRTNVLVKASSTPKTYFLRTFPIEMGRNADANGAATVVPGDIVAEVVVLPESFPMNLPPEPLPVTRFLDPITDEELAAHGGLKRTIVMRVIGSNPAVDPTTGLPFTGTAKTPLVNPPPGELPQWIYQVVPPGQTQTTQIASKVYALGAAGTTGTTNPALPSTYIPFQSSKALTQTVALDSVEEWTIVNMNNIRHPFHIHVNPMYIVAVNGKPIEPYWADTVPMPYNNSTPQQPPPVPAPAQSSITFRMRFRDFTGRYVMHCHMLVHEDMGMMQQVIVQGPLGV